MTDTWIIVGLCVLVLVSIACELWRRRRKSNATMVDVLFANQIGYNQAALGFGREDYPMDYTDAEREAWQRGWDEYHERN